MLLLFGSFYESELLTDGFSAAPICDSNVFVSAALLKQSTGILEGLYTRSEEYCAVLLKNKEVGFDYEDDVWEDFVFRESYLCVYTVQKI